MRKSVFVIVFLFYTFSGFAQFGGGPFRRSPEERAAALIQKLDSAFQLNAEKKSLLDTALKTLYRAQEAKRQELMTSGIPDRETLMQEMKKFNDAQDEILKSVLTKEQFDIWKEKIQPSMRPRRPEGGFRPSDNNP
ncbi:MAG: hypothetical protein N2747_04295 [Chitinophagaceae bacterium]|nr:hypothetical protein [Chitinophagaceae bacterium]